MNESKINLDSESIRIRYHRIHKNDYTGLKLKKPIFIIGVPHSGTSVLSSLFNIHPDVAMWTEAPEVWEPYWAEGVDSDYDSLVPVEENYVKYRAEMDDAHPQLSVKEKVIKAWELTKEHHKENENGLSC